MGVVHVLASFDRLRLHPYAGPRDPIHLDAEKDVRVAAIPGRPVHGYPRDSSAWLCGHDE